VACKVVLALTTLCSNGPLLLCVDHKTSTQIDLVQAISLRPRRSWLNGYGRLMEQGRPLYFCPVVSSSSIFFLLFFLAYSQPSQMGCLPYFHTWCGLSANLGCTRLAENTGRKKSSKIRHLRTIANFVGLYLRN